jgi:hypothetical protein
VSDAIDDDTQEVLQALALVRRFRELEARGHVFTAEERSQLTMIGALLVDLRSSVSKELAASIGAITTDAERIRAIFGDVPPGSA